MTPRDPATSFGAAAEQYDTARPGYPDEVVDWLLDGIGGGGSIVDVGAGTGKLTRALSRRRPDVRAVEPDAEMRTLMLRRSPHLTALDGSAEALPLEDASVSLVTFAQAWHWVDVVPGCAEAARVLARPGRLGLVWNYRDESDEWAMRLGQVMGGTDSAGDGDRIRVDGPDLAPPFTTPERLVVPWRHTIDVDTLVALAASRSYVIVRSEPERRAVMEAVRRLGLERADRDGRLDMPYVSHAFRSDLLM